MEQALSLRWGSIAPGGDVPPPPAVTDHHKDMALYLLGVTRGPSETHLVAWLRAMSDENRLPHTTAAAQRLVEAVLSDPVLLRFVRWLA